MDVSLPWTVLALGDAVFAEERGSLVVCTVRDCLVVYCGVGFNKGVVDLLCVCLCEGGRALPRPRRVMSLSYVSRRVDLPAEH